MKNSILASFILCIAIIHCNAQTFLALDKGRPGHRARYYPGDEITFKTNQSRHFIHGRIEAIGDSILISGTLYALSDFKKIKTHPSAGMRSLLLSGAVQLPYAGTVIMVAEGVTTYLHDDYPLVRQKQIKISAGFFLAGFIMWKLSFHTYNINERHPLRVFRLDPVRNY